MALWSFKKKKWPKRRFFGLSRPHYSANFDKSLDYGVFLVTLQLLFSWHCRKSNRSSVKVKKHKSLTLLQSRQLHREMAAMLSYTKYTKLPGNEYINLIAH